MSADTTEQYAAGGDDLRARYLPVSRKELRRRRELELAAQQPEEDQGAEEQESPEDQSAEDHPAEQELAQAVEHTTAAEGDDAAADPEVPTEESGEEEIAYPDEDATQVIGAITDEEPAEVPAISLPKPPEPDEEPARPEEEVADGEEPDVDDLEAVDPQAEEFSGVGTESLAETEAVLEEEAAAEVESEGVDSSETELPETDPAQDSDEAEPEDEEEPSSRRERRLLRETQSIPPMSPELLAEIDATQAEIAKIDDPNKVDPELLKKQQALAAKAMQANQERFRKQKAEEEKEARRRRRERPESQVLTEKMVRDSLEIDPEEMDYFTGQIEPVHAQGAHGLDLNKMIDATSRQAERQNVLVWLVVILAILLVAAVVAVIFFMVL